MTKEQQHWFVFGLVEGRNDTAAWLKDLAENIENGNCESDLLPEHLYRIADACQQRNNVAMAFDD